MLPGATEKILLSVTFRMHQSRLSSKGHRTCLDRPGLDAAGFYAPDGLEFYPRGCVVARFQPGFEMNLLRSSVSDAPRAERYQLLSRPRNRYPCASMAKTLR